MYFTDHHLESIKNEPHRLGHMIGYNLLTNLHSKWIKYIWDSTEDRSLQAHRDSYKTTSILIVGSIRWMLFFPGDRIGIIRKKLDDASKVLNVISEIMRLTEIQELFKYAHGFYPEFEEENRFRLTFNFKDTLTPEGNINAFGIESSLTGVHLEKPMMDDVITIKDRTSRATRENTKIMIQEVRTNIAEQGQYKSTGFIGTPWHKNDGWTSCPIPIKFDVNSTGILTKEEIEERKAKITPSLWSVNYDLKHAPDDMLLFNNPKYKKWKFHCESYGHLDAAFDGSASNALTFMANMKDHHQAIGFHFAGNVKKWTDTIVEKYHRYRCRALYIEDNADKGYTGDELKNKGLNIISYSEDMDKDTKISIFLFALWKELYFADDSDPEYMEQIIDYYKGVKPNDAPDSISSLIRKKFHKSKSYVDALYAM